MNFLIVINDSASGSERAFNALRLVGSRARRRAPPRSGRRQAFRKVRYLPYPKQVYLEISGLLSPDKVARPEQEEDNSPI